MNWMWLLGLSRDWGRVGRSWYSGRVRQGLPSPRLSWSGKKFRIVGHLAGPAIFIHDDETKDALGHQMGFGFIFSEDLLGPNFKIDIHRWITDPQQFGVNSNDIAHMHRNLKIILSNFFVFTHSSNLLLLKWVARFRVRISDNRGQITEPDFKIHILYIFMQNSLIFRFYAQHSIPPILLHFTYRHTTNCHVYSNNQRSWFTPRCIRFASLTNRSWEGSSASLSIINH